MEIWQAIEEVSKYADRHKKQMKYDLGRERIYELGSLYAVSFKPDSVLDIGCAYGTMAYILKKAGVKIETMDIDASLHSKKMFADMGIKFIKKNIETDRIDKKYDVILFTDVLEHLCYNPLPAMKKIRNACNKGIVIATPAKEIDFVCEGKWCHEVSWRQIPDLEKYEFTDGHHHTYYLWELADLLREAGFRVIEYQLLPVEKTWVVKAEVIK